MPNWNDRRWERRRESRDDPERDDVHAGPWSPYNGLERDREPDDRRYDERRYRDAWGDRGRDYWIESDVDEAGPRDWPERREDRRVIGRGDPWRRFDDDDPGEDDEGWGNRMGLRGEPVERSIPRSGAWQHEPRYGEMEQMWSDRDDRMWPRERHDSIEREVRGEQYPSGARRHWSDERDRRWRDEPTRYERDVPRYSRGEPPRDWRDDPRRYAPDLPPRDWRDRDDELRRDDRDEPRRGPGRYPSHSYAPRPYRDPRRDDRVHERADRRRGHRRDR